MSSPLEISESSLILDGSAVHLAATRGEAGPCPLLLLHGAGMDGRVWSGVLDRLAAEGLAAWAPDFPAHGRSKGAPLPTIAELAGWTLRLADALCMREFALAGHSMGALAAIEAAAGLGERARGLALIGAAAELPVNPALLAAAREDLQHAAGMISGWGYGPAAQTSGLAEAGRRMIAASRAGTLAADLEACADYAGAAEAAGRVRCPVLVLAGAKDRMTPAKRGRGLAEAIPGARFVELPEIGHMLPEEAPDAVAEALVTLVK